MNILYTVFSTGDGEKAYLLDIDDTHASFLSQECVNWASHLCIGEIRRISAQKIPANYFHYTPDPHPFPSFDPLLLGYPLQDEDTPSLNEIVRAVAMYRRSAHLPLLHRLKRITAVYRYTLTPSQIKRLLALLMEDSGETESIYLKLHLDSQLSPYL